jgi:hypothetical protein
MQLRIVAVGICHAARHCEQTLIDRAAEDQRNGTAIKPILEAEDGYRAERSYSIASPPEVSALELTVDRLDDGEVSPFLTNCNPTTRFNYAGRSEGISSGLLWNRAIRFCWLAAGVELCR